MTSYTEEACPYKPDCNDLYHNHTMTPEERKIDEILRIESQEAGTKVLKLIDVNEAKASLLQMLKNAKKEGLHMEQTRHNVRVMELERELDEIKTAWNRLAKLNSKEKES